MAEVKNEEERNRNVGGDEALDVPVALEEDGKAIGEGEEGDDEQDEPGGVWLERSPVREGIE